MAWRLWIGLWAAFLSAPLCAEVQVLMADNEFAGSALACPYYFLCHWHTMAGRESLSLSNDYGVLLVTRDQIYQTYRKLGTVPESEIDTLMKEDALFPAGAVIYLRSVNDETGQVEGIMRVVTSDLGGRGFFNHHMSRKAVGTAKARVPIEAKYLAPEFQAFLLRHYPQRTELGRVVFGEGVNEFRVLLDMVSVAVDLSYFPHFSTNHHLLVEAVRPAIHRYTELGLKEVAAPISFNDGRVLMAMSMPDAYNRHRGNVDKLVAEFERLKPGDLAGQARIVAEMDEAIKKVSSHPAIQRFYLYGYYRRAELFFAIDDFENMVKDVRRLVRSNPTNRDVKLFELFAEAGNLFNWETGKGDPAKAIAYLDSPAAVERFADKSLPEGASDHLREYVKGLVYLGSGDYAKARAVRLKMDADDEEQRLARAAEGQRLRKTKTEEMAYLRILGVRERFYDPAQGGGNPQGALHELSLLAPVSPMALSPQFHEYRSQVLRALGRHAEATKAAQIATALR